MTPTTKNTTHAPNSRRHPRTALTDLRLNMVGVLVGCGAVVVTSCFQVWTGMIQKELGVSGQSFMSEITPPAALMATVVRVDLSL